LFGKYIQELIFGELRLVELQRIKDKFWNYAFYKFCFLFGVLGLENLNELVLWISWFSVLSFALLFCQLAKDRYELVNSIFPIQNIYIFFFHSYPFRLQFVENLL
jgi:autocrine motility factor receptor